MKKTLNLLPPSLPKPVAGRKIAIWAAAAAAFYAAALAGMWLLDGYEMKKLDSAVTELQGKRLLLQKYVAVSAAPREVPAGADPAILGMMRATPPWDAVLAEISLVAPGGVQIEAIDSPDAKHMRIKGYAKTQEDIARLIEAFEGSQYFGGIEMVFARKGDKALAFELRAEMRWT